MPKWLKEKLEKTEWDVKQEAAKKALQATEAQKKHIPKWLQGGSSKSYQTETVSQEKQMPNWLSNNKSFPVDNQGEDHQTKAQIPKWLQAKMPAAPRNTTGQINPGKKHFLELRCDHSGLLNYVQLIEEKCGDQNCLFLA